MSLLQDPRIECNAVRVVLKTLSRLSSLLLLPSSLRPNLLNEQNAMRRLGIAYAMFPRIYTSVDRSRHERRDKQWECQPGNAKGRHPETRLERRAILFWVTQYSHGEDGFSPQPCVNRGASGQPFPSQARDPSNKRWHLLADEWWIYNWQRILTVGRPPVTRIADFTLTESEFGRRPFSYRTRNSVGPRYDRIRYTFRLCLPFGPPAHVRWYSIVLGLRDCRMLLRWPCLVNEIGSAVMFNIQ